MVEAAGVMVMSLVIVISSVMVDGAAVTVTVEAGRVIVDGGAVTETVAVTVAVEVTVDGVHF